jgi:hypothetical protein
VPALEYLIRPVVVPDYQPTPQPAPTPTDPDKQERLLTLDGGSLRIIQMTGSGSYSASKSEAHKEVRRFVTTIRVHNPQDRDQYVDVQVPLQIKMTSPGKFELPGTGDGAGVAVDDVGQVASNIAPPSGISTTVGGDSGPQQDFKYAPVPDSPDTEVLDPGRWQDNPNFKP